MLLTDFGYKKSMTDSSLFVLDNSNDSVNMVGSVSYTHLTLPTNREV